LFKYNTSATDFSYVFNNNNKLQLNKWVFYSDGEEDTRFLNKTVNFSNCFYRTTFSGIQGEAPELWDCDFGTGSATKTNCYAEAGNSETSLSNYCDIPTDWGATGCTTTTTAEPTTTTTAAPTTTTTTAELTTTTTTI